MSGLGNSGIDRFNDLDELLGGSQEPTPEEEQAERPPAKEAKPLPKDEKLLHQKSVKFTDTEDEWLSTLMVAMGTKNAAEAVRWCVRKVYEEYGEEVEKIAKKKAKIGAMWDGI